MISPDIMFATQALENRFRDVANSEHEIGGWLFFSYWKSDIDYKTFKAETGKHYLLAIESWLLVPNVAEFPASSWQSSNFKQFEACAKTTAQSLGLMSLFFHSHPSGNNEPSHTDIAFTLNHCPLWRNAGESVIVSANHLRVNSYIIQREKRKIEIIKGDYWSWRHKLIKKASGVAYWNK